MWYSVWEYTLLVVAVSIVSHTVFRRYFPCVIVCSMTCSLLNLLHESWLAGWNVNPGWAPPLLFWGAVIALPVAAVVGITPHKIKQDNLRPKLVLPLFVTVSRLFRDSKPSRCRGQKQ